MTATGEIRIGVIGAGGRGILAHNAHQPDQGVRLVAAMDINEKHLNDFKDKFGPNLFLTKNYKEMLDQDDIDAVFVTSPYFLHEEHTLACLNSDKDVYLEKPMAITVEGCDRILAAAMKNKRKLYLGHNMRHMNFVLKMKELIDEGAIGQVTAGWCRHFCSYGGEAYYKDWHADSTKSTGLLLQKGAHDIDILHWLCGGYTQKVTAMGKLGVYNQISDRHELSEYGDATWTDAWPPLSLKQLNPVIDVEDLSMMLMQLDNGVLCSYQQCHYTPDGWRNYTIIGTEGRIENYGDDPGLVRLYNQRTFYNPDGDKQYDIPVSKGGHGGSDVAIVNDFISYLRGESKPQTSPLAARNSVAAGFMATCSLRNSNIAMDVPPIDENVAKYFES